MNVRFPGPTGRLRIGVFGGSFDPAHEGHAHVAETALRRLQLDWVWWVPARGNPLKSRRVSFQSRFASAERMATSPQMRVTDIEQQLEINYTIDLVRALKRFGGATQFVWIMGADNLNSFHRWGQWREIASLMPIAVVARPGAGVSARLSTFSKVYAKYRVPEYVAARLPTLAPPAWTYLTAPWNSASSTSLRRQSRARNPFRRA